MKQAGAFVESEKLNAGYYGTSLSVIEKFDIQYKIPVFIVDPDAAGRLKHIFMELNMNVVDILIISTEEKVLNSEEGIDSAVDILVSRIKSRNRSTDAKRSIFEQRKAHAKEWLMNRRRSTYIVANIEDNLLKAIEKVEEIIFTINYLN